MKTLYRPTGFKELQLIVDAYFKKFPPRLEWQPIFYPVLNKEYACEIASKWNTKDEFGDYLGFVTAFDISDEEFSKYEVQNVGASHHNELWVPAEKLEDFNTAITSKIRLVDVFIGENFKGFKDYNFIDILYCELNIYEIRLNHFLATKSRTVLPFDYFDPDSADDYEVQRLKADFEVLRKKAESIHSVHEAVDFLIEECLTEAYIQKIKDEININPMKRQINNHFGINMLLRNLFFYSGNEKLVESIREDKTALGARFGERGEGIIENILWRRLNNCEFPNAANKSKMEAIQKQVDDFHAQFFADRGLIMEKMTFDDWEPYLDEYGEAREKNNIYELGKRIEFLSYNFTEDQVERYMIVEEKENYREKYFEKSLILANVEEENLPTLKLLKDTYFNFYEVVEKLKEHYETQHTKL
jgi:hypothetical protein